MTGEEKSLLQRYLADQDGEAPADSDWMSDEVFHQWYLRLRYCGDTDTPYDPAWRNTHPYGDHLYKVVLDAARTWQEHGQELDRSYDRGFNDGKNAVLDVL